MFNQLIAVISFSKQKPCECPKNRFLKIAANIKLRQVLCKAPKFKEKNNINLKKVYVVEYMTALNYGVTTRVELK